MCIQMEGKIYMLLIFSEIPSLPRNPKKYLHAQKDETYQQAIHELHETHKLSEQVCRYDLDELDVAWLRVYNEQREEMGEFY